MEKKICTKCKLNKELDKFRYRKDKGRNISICKECEFEYNKKWFKKNPENRKKYNSSYYVENSEKVKKQTKNYILNNEEKVKIARKKHYQKNQDKIKKHIQNIGLPSETQKKQKENLPAINCVVLTFTFTPFFICHEIL
jgi:hypothetical protein